MSFAPLDLERERLRTSGDVYQRPEQQVYAAMRRAQQTYLNTLEARWRAEIARRSSVPLGVRVTPRGVNVAPVSSLPTVAQPTAGTTAAQILRTASGQQAAQNEAIFSDVPRRTSEMDLGDILGGISQAVDIYGRYRGYRDPGGAIMGDPGSVFGQRSQPRQQFVTSPRPQVGMDTFGVQPAFFPPAILGAGSLGSKIGTAIAGLGLGLAADEIAAVAATCARVKSRRRRRRLATHSDIKDLAALKAVLGSGKAFDTWIATRKM